MDIIAQAQRPMTVAQPVVQQVTQLDGVGDSSDEDLDDLDDDEDDDDLDDDKEDSAGEESGGKEEVHNVSYKYFFTTLPLPLYIKAPILSLLFFYVDY
jgi:hypothetical protein